MTTLPPGVPDLSVWIGQEILDESRAEAVLSAASNLVAAYADKASEWAAGDVPDDVYDIVVQVAARVYLSPPNTNVRQWTRGPFGEGYFDAAQNGLVLTAEEKVSLGRFNTAASPGLGTIGTTRGDLGTDTVYVPTGPPPAGYPFPWYAADGY